ncbi:MAG: mechanosensitive ion channel family protein [Candidatus Micrarchaeia archaeon]
MLELVLVSVVLLVASVVVSEVLVQVLNRLVKPLASRTRTTLDDRLVAVARLPLRLLGLFVGVYFALDNFFPGAVFWGRSISFWWGSFLVVWGGFAAARLGDAVVSWYGSEFYPELEGRARISADVVPLLRRLVKALAWLVALIVLLDRFGVEVGPLVAALGIGGLAVAFALKDILSNFFASVYLLSEKPVKTGEFIALENEKGVVKGFVEEIDWRVTRVRTRDNFVYFIPNEKIVLGAIVNFSRGRGSWKGSSVLVGVDYSADVKKVKKVLARAVAGVQEEDARLVKGVEPRIRLEGFGSQGYVFRVQYRVTGLQEAEEVDSLVRERIVEEFERNGIKLKPA